MKLTISLFLVFSSMFQTVMAAESLDDFNDIQEFVVTPINQAIIDKLRGGGYVLYMRHGNTDTSRPDQIDMDLNDCATQRPLTAEGRRVVAKIGRAIRKERFPLGEIISSPMCRTKDTAAIAFGKNITLNNQLRYTANMTDVEKFQALETIRELVSSPVAGNVNRVIVAHSQNLMALLGYLPSPEGTVVIFKPMGNKQFKYIASVKPTQWETIQP